LAATLTDLEKVPFSAPTDDNLSIATSLADFQPAD